MEHRLEVCAPAEFHSAESGKRRKSPLGAQAECRCSESGEGGKKVSPKGFGPQARSQNIRPVRLIRQRDSEPRNLRPWSAFSLQTDSGIRQSASDREKTSSQKEE